MIARLTQVRWLSLAGLGGSSLLVYWIGLLRPYNLFALEFKPLLDIAQFTRGNPTAQAGFALTFAVLSGLYYLAWRVCRISAPWHPKRPSRSAWVALSLSLLALNLSMLWLYPIGAADIFDNIIRGRMTAQYRGNPFYETPDHYADDMFHAYTAWHAFTSAYGPLWELLAAGTSRITGDNLLANILAFKALNLLFYLGCILLLVRILSRHAPERALQGVCLFAWNPLVIYETAGNGHNDIVMVFCILLGLDMLLRARFTWAALAFVAGALVKFIPGLLLPLALIAAVRVLPSHSRRISSLLVTLSACFILVAASFAPFWRGGDPFDVTRRTGLFTSSLPAVVQAQLEPALGAPVSKKMVSQAAFVYTLGIVAAAGWHVWSKISPSRGSMTARDPSQMDWLVPVRACASVLLFYLLVTCLWFQAWYTVWPLALAALLPEGATARLAVLLSYSALWKTFIFGYFIYPGGPLPLAIWRETRLGPATLGLTWLYATSLMAGRAMSRLQAQLSTRRPNLATPNPSP